MVRVCERERERKEGERDSALTWPRRSLSFSTSSLLSLHTHTPGATGLDGPHPTAGMFATADERGVLTANPVRAGGVAFTVPLRLALLDSGRPPSRAAAAALPWAARLALRLLAEAAAGPASPYAPWLRVLPAEVPSAYGGGPAAASLARAGAALLPCPAAVAAVTSPQAAVAAEWAAVQAAGLAPPGVDDAAWAWARGVVQSRAFGLLLAPPPPGGATASAAPAGAPQAPPPAIVRALVPLADMLNHAGDEAALLLAGPAAATDTAAWALVPPPPGGGGGGGGTGGGGGWSFAVSASADLAVNSELTLNYGAGRPNADFLASYGFVPPRNAHESVSLFCSVEEAVRWACGSGGGGDVSPSLLAAALAAAASASTPDDAAGLAHSEEAVRAEAGRLRLWAGGRADGRAVAALTAALGGDAAAASTAIAARAAQLLAACVARGSGAPLLPSLAELGRAAAREEAALAGDECGGSACGEPASVWTALGRRYAALAPVLRSVPGLEGAAVDGGGGGAAAAAAVPAALPALSAPPGARETWRRARLAALTAAAYSTMVLWDAVAGAVGRGGDGARAAIAAAVERRA